MESKIDQNYDYFSEILKSNFQIQNLKLALLFFENLTVDFQISYFREKKIIRPNYYVFSRIYLYLLINLIVLRNFLTLYWATG